MRKSRERLLIVSSCISRTIGGISNTLYYLANELSVSNDLTILGYLFDEKIANANILMKQNQKFFIEEHFHRKVRIWLYSIFKDYSKYDRVLCAAWTEAIAVVFFQRKRPQYYVMVHGNELMGERTRGIKPIHLKYRLRDYILSHSEKLFANSEYTKNVCKEKWPSKECVVIHPPIDITVKKPERERHDDKFIIITVSRLEKRKGIQYTVKAVARLVKKYPNLVYRIVGGGDYKDTIDKMITVCQLEKNIVLVGRVSEEEKYRELANSDLFVMPSFKTENSVEGFGVSYLEANLMGIPVIGTYSGGIADAIIDGKTGVLIDEKDVDTLEKTIEKFIKREIQCSKEDCIDWAKEHSSKKAAEKYQKELMGI